MATGDGCECVHVHSGKEKRMNRAKKKGVRVGEGRERTGLGNKWMSQGKKYGATGFGRLHPQYTNRVLRSGNPQNTK